MLFWNTNTNCWFNYSIQYLLDSNWRDSCWKLFNTRIKESYTLTLVLWMSTNSQYYPPERAPSRYERVSLRMFRKLAGIVTLLHPTTLRQLTTIKFLANCAITFVFDRYCRQKTKCAYQVLFFSNKTLLKRIKLVNTMTNKFNCKILVNRLILAVVAQAPSESPNEVT